MIPIEGDQLINNNIYYIESHGPTGLIAKMRGVFTRDGNNLLRFDDVIQYKDGKQINIDWFHAPTILSVNEKSNYYWKYFIPNDTNIKKKVKKMDIQILLTKMLLLRKVYSQKIGDPSTIIGMTQMRFGL